MVFILIDKVTRAYQMIDLILNRESRKVTIKQIQKLAGFLNFLCRCVIPGCAFTRRQYLQMVATKPDGTKVQLQPHHHVCISNELRQDLNMWKQFLAHPTVYCRPFLDFTDVVTAYQANFFTDASGGIGFGGLCYNSWMSQIWDKSFVRKKTAGY